ncbi:MAG TPA: adenosylmethionine--8-amino-7-oxononanoate transaminase [Rhodocyclaceae bacterium]|nr:adenosylmethionine--8-amino-7-oxononanoate transaminase [Rhodocyclaceae bacterium]
MPATPDIPDLLSRSLAAVWHPCTQMKHHEQLPLVPIARGEGLWLFDPEGRRYLDGVSSWWVNLFGHCNPRINTALRDQLETLEHVMLAGFTHAPVVELSERLSALTDHSLSHCFYASDGASATEIALKMSHHYWRNSGQAQKSGFLCLEGSYHGETVGALAVTDITIFREAYSSLSRDVRTVPSPDARKALPGETAADVARRAAAGLEQVLVEHVPEIAALIVEPLVQCATGFAMHDPLYLKLAREICDRHNVHLICDEIAVGCGRSGTFFAHEQAGIRPDFLCLSKGISGGYLPLSVVMTTDKVYQAFYDDATARGFLHSHSYTGNPLACRAALATLDIFEQDDVINANRQRSARFTAQLEPLRTHPRVKHFRQQGMMWAFDVIDAPADFPRRFFRAGLEREILLRPIGNTVYFMPPYILDDESGAFLAEQSVAALEASL